MAALLAALTATTADAHRDPCWRHACQHRILERHYRHVWRMAPAYQRAHLDRIAACESHGNPRAVSASGTYRGKYQFAFGTWATVGGRGDPAAASEAEQDSRAVRLYHRDGPGQWPICGR